MTDPKRLQRLNALLDEALALPQADRGDWLARRADSERTLLPALGRMLSRAAVNTDTFLRAPAAATMDALAAAEARPDQAGDRIGPYRLLERLGEGGMATVWRAERVDGALAREVALKLPHVDARRGLAQRMARERDLLAALEHPHIARLYDAGVTEGGRPWLAMQRVCGVPIDDHVRQRALGVSQVLQLALQICDALAHAHARLIVHRDLKPANLLVTASGEVMLLDFGVGKLLHDERDPAGIGPPLTQMVGSAMTPDYASPEQVGGRPVTVATDVYSLGVVLYELLSGQRPYRLGRRSTAALEEAILGADIAPPSSRCLDRARARALRGDLDAILAKALAKNPSRRYASVESLASDLRAHRDGLPVQAQPPHRRYRMAKFVRRHRWPLALGSGVALSLLIGLGAALWQGQAARQEARRADQARQFIAGLLAEAEPQRGSAAAGAVRSTDLLVRAGERIERELSGDPRLAAELGVMIGEQLSSLGEPQRGEATLRAAVQRAQATLGPRHLLTVRGRALLVESLSVQHPQEARQLVDALVPDALAGLPGTAAVAVFALRSQSFQLAKLNQVQPSVERLQQAVAVAEQHLGANHAQTLISLGLLSNTHGRFRQFDQQLAVANEAMLRAQTALMGARPHVTLTAVERWYGEALRRNDRPADAVPILRRVVQDQRVLDGADTPRVRNALYQLSLALGEAGALGEAIGLMRQVVDMEAQQNAVLNEDRLNYRRSLGVLLGFARRGPEVEATFDEVEAMQQAYARSSARHGALPEAASTAPTGSQLLARARAARVMAYRGLFDLAEAELAGRLAEVDALAQPEPGLRLEVWHSLALSARLQGRLAQARQRAQDGWDDPARPHARPAAQAGVATELAAAALEQGDIQRAEAINREALALWTRAQVGPSPLSATAHLTQARLLLRAGRAREVLQTLQPLEAAWAEAHPGSVWHAEVRHWRARAFTALDRGAEPDRSAAQALLRQSNLPALQRLAGP